MTPVCLQRGCFNGVGLSKRTPSRVAQRFVSTDNLNYQSVVVTSGKMNATNSNKTLSTCFSVKCQFTFGERFVIIFFFTLIFIASLFGNSVLFSAILRHKRLRKSSTNFSILSLSLANIFITVFCIPVFVIDVFIVDKWIFGVIACKLVAFMQNLAINAAIFTLVIIGVEKFLVVYFPFHVRSQRTKVRYLVLGGWVIGIMQSSVYLSYKAVKVFNGIPYCIESWPSYKIRQIFNVVQAVALRFVPLTFMICLHIVTIMKIKARLQYRRTNEQDDTVSVSGMVQANPQALKSRKKAVVMLVVIVTASALTLFPYYACICWRMLGNPESLRDPYASNVVFIVTMWLVFFNSVCHPIIFGLMSTEYRKAARRTLSMTWKSPGSIRSRSSIRKQNRQDPIKLMTAQVGKIEGKESDPGQGTTSS